jgi:hypothetical protein
MQCQVENGSVAAVLYRKAAGPAGIAVDPERDSTPRRRGEALGLDPEAARAKSCAAGSGSSVGTTVRR